MSDPNLNALWCRCLVEDLARGGLAHAVLCPGSRNSPLLFALAERLGDRCLSHVDERGAAFAALGLAQATGLPAAVCCTSGSAVANLMPALVEAHATGAPLVLITGDRPEELHGCGAPQTMPQTGIFTSFLVRELALPAPSIGEAAFLALRRDASAAIAASRGPRPGPVQINVPLRDPLPPLPDADWRQPIFDAASLDDGPAETPPASRLRATPDDLAAVVAALRPGMRGLIVAGPQCPLNPRQVDALARHTGFPVLADAASNLRRPAVAHLVASADALVTGALGQAEAEVLIRLGPAPVARALYEFCARQRCPVIRIDRVPVARDFLHRSFIGLADPDDEQLRGLGERADTGDRIWRQTWATAAAAATAALSDFILGEPWNEITASHTAVNHPEARLLHLASSMPIRHGNLHCLPRPAEQRVFANRGLSGIDGTIATFIGELRGDRRPGLLLVGDLAAFHDLPSFALARTATTPGAIVILNNDGGGIFDFLPVAAVDGYRPLVRTPHGLDFAHVAAQFGLDYDRVDQVGDLHAAIGRALAQPTVSVIECALAGSDTVARHRALVKAMAEG